MLKPFGNLSRSTNTKFFSDQACTFDDDYATRTGNAFTKLWFQNFARLANDETSFLEGLTSHSPVAYMQYISNDFLAYSGGK